LQTGVALTMTLDGRNLPVLFFEQP